MTTIWPLSLIMRESYNTPERVYRLAKARGMDLVAITDHDTIDGALALAHLPDVVVGCEVSASFPRTGVDVHLGVLDITPTQFAEIDRLRPDVAQLLPYLRQQGIFTVVNHVASQVNGRLTPAHIASLLPWVDAFEVINGSRLPTQNRTALGPGAIGGQTAHRRQRFAYGPRHRPHLHGRGGATTREAFMAGLRAGQARAGGQQGSYFTMASDMLRFAGRFYQERAIRLVRAPHRWPGHAFVIGGVVGLPLHLPAARRRDAGTSWKRTDSTSRCCSISWRLRRSPSAPGNDCRRPP